MTSKQMLSCRLNCWSSAFIEKFMSKVFVKAICGRFRLSLHPTINRKPFNVEHITASVFSLIEQERIKWSKISDIFILQRKSCFLNPTVQNPLFGPSFLLAKLGSAWSLAWYDDMACLKTCLRLDGRITEHATGPVHPSDKENKTNQVWRDFMILVCAINCIYLCFCQPSCHNFHFIPQFRPQTVKISTPFLCFISVITCSYDYDCLNRDWHKCKPWLRRERHARSPWDSMEHIMARVKWSGWN